MWSRILAATAAATVAAAWAAPAAAVTLVFNVNVSSAEGVAGFTPFSFQQTWTLEPGTQSASAALIGGRLQGTAAATSSPVERNLAAELPASLGVMSTAGGYDFHAGAVPALFGTAARALFGASFERRSTITGFGPTLVQLNRVTLQSQYFDLFSPTAPFAADDPGLVAFLSGSPLLWDERAVDHAPALGGEIIRWAYHGVATLALAPAPEPPVAPSAVPEPSSWALLIAGFGLVGAAVRRRASPRPA